MVMKKLNKKTLKSLVVGLTAVLLLTVTLGGLNVVKAGSMAGLDWDTIQSEVIAGLIKAALPQPVEGMLGAAGTRFPNGISADSTSPSAGEVRGTTLTITGAGTTAGLTSSADTRAASLVRTGSVATFSSATTTYTATAANVCDNPLWTVTTPGGASTLTLPATSTLLADCLSTNGDSIDLTILNGSGTTSTVIAAGSGGTLLYSSTTTIAAGKAALLKVVRDATATYKAMLVNTPN